MLCPASVPMLSQIMAAVGSCPLACVKHWSAKPGSSFSMYNRPMPVQADVHLGSNCSARLNAYCFTSRLSAEVPSADHRLGEHGSSLNAPVIEEIECSPLYCEWWHVFDPRSNASSGFTGLEFDPIGSTCSAATLLQNEAWTTSNKKAQRDILQSYPMLSEA